MDAIGMSELLVILVVVLIFGLIVLIPHWVIFGKAGFSRWLSLLMILPLVNVIMLYILAFSEWPSLKNRPSGLSPDSPGRGEVKDSHDR